MLKSFRDLKAWQKSYQLAINIYKLTENFPSEEKYCLVSQMRRASISIPSNIAEGYGRRTIHDYVRCLYIAYSSCCELDTQTLLSGDLDYVDSPDLTKITSEIQEVERILNGLIKSLEIKSSRSLEISTTQVQDKGTQS